VLNLISTTLMLLVGFAKLGVQHSIIRFYGEISAGKRDAGLREFYSTIVFGMAGAGLVVSILWVLLGQFVLLDWWNDERVRNLILPTAALVLLRAVNSGVINILRAQQRSTVYIVYSVLSRYIGLGIILLIMFYAVSGLEGFYLGTIVAEAAAVVIMLVFLARHCLFSPSAFSAPLYRAMLVFGIPMISTEVGWLLLSYGDRYVIQTMLGGEPLGLYSAAFNLCEYIETVLVASIETAIMPIYVKLWEEKGEAEVRSFIEKSTHFYFLLGAAVVAGISAVGEDLLVLLASDKYREGSGIIPWVISAMVISGTSTIAAAGIYIHKQTHILMVLVIVSAILNLLLNVILVPILGIHGSAIATLISLSLLSVATLVVSNRNLPVAIPWKMLAKFTVLALMMYMVVVQVSLDGVFSSLALKVSVGIICYTGLVLMFDRRSQEAMAVLLRRIR
jgi:O-antigen/teichoic acid export membrane protein